MSQKFNRKIDVTIFKGADQVGLKISDLRINFEITKDQLGYPQLAMIEIYNLKRDNQNKIKNVFDRVVVNAGYEDSVNQIFLGDIRNVEKIRQGVDMITRIWAASADKGLKQGILNYTAGANTDVKSIINEAVSAFGDVVIGRIDELTGNKKIMGESYSGSAKQILDRLAKDYEFDWFIEDGKLNVLKPETTINTPSTAIEISSTTGMIDIPALTERGIMVKTLLDSNIKIGKLIKVVAQSTTVQLGNLFFRDINKTLGVGIYKVIKIIHAGDTHTKTWQSTVEGILYNG